AGACLTTAAASTIVVVATPGTIGPSAAQHEEFQIGIVHAMLTLPAKGGRGRAPGILSCWRLRFCRPKLPVEKPAGRTSRGKTVRSNFARYSNCSEPASPSRWRAWLFNKLCLLETEFQANENKEGTSI